MPAVFGVGLCGGLADGLGPVGERGDAVVVPEAVQLKVSRQQPQQDPVHTAQHEAEGEASLDSLPSPHFPPREIEVHSQNVIMDWSMYFGREMEIGK